MLTQQFLQIQQQIQNVLMNISLVLFAFEIVLLLHRTMHLVLVMQQAPAAPSLLVTHVFLLILAQSVLQATKQVLAVLFVH